MVYYNEFDPKAAAWLRELISMGLIAEGEVDARSIVDVRPSDLRGFTQCHFFAGIGTWSYALRLAGWPDDRPCWTGSPPCQPFSVAGKGDGGADARHLAPVWLDLVKECRPSVLFGEQVPAAIAHGWWDDLHTRLEEEGYACGMVVLGAHSAGAPHIRQRIWFVAQSQPLRLQKHGIREPGIPLHTGEGSGFVVHADGQRQDGEHPLLRPEAGGRLEGDLPEASGGGSDRVAHLCGEGLEGRGVRRDGAAERASGAGGVDFWSDAVWLPCRDGKLRPTGPGIWPLVQRVGDTDTKCHIPIQRERELQESHEGGSCRERDATTSDSVRGTVPKDRRVTQPGPLPLADGSAPKLVCLRYKGPQETPRNEAKEEVDDDVRLLRGTIGEETTEGANGEDHQICPEKVLRQNLHGVGIYENYRHECRDQQGESCEECQASMLRMWSSSDGKTSQGPPLGWESSQQCREQPENSLLKLSHESTFIKLRSDNTCEEKVSSLHQGCLSKGPMLHTLLQDDETRRSEAYQEATGMEKIHVGGRVGFVPSGDTGEPNPNATSEARVMRLKAYGNGIVAQTAALFIETCMEVL